MRFSKSTTGHRGDGTSAVQVRKSHGFALGFALLAAAAPSECGTPNTPVVQVKCNAVNDFGYVANASGTLQITGRKPSGAFSVSGSIQIDAHFIDDPSNPRTVTVAGEVDAYGSSLFGDVVSGASDLDSVFFNFQNSFGSHVRSKTTTEYQTQCTASTVRMPQVGDLVPQSTLRFQTVGGLIRAQIDMTNIGNVAITSTSVRTRIAGADVMGTLFANAGSSSPVNTLGPGESGYLQVELPSGSLSRCSSYSVAIDVNRTVQTGAHDPFVNDSATVSSPCLRWNTPITADSLGATPDALLQFKTLEQIVSSTVVARADGNRCSVCHFAGSSRLYSPPAGTISPTLVVGGKTWAGAAGWTSPFKASFSKPANLKQAFQRWLDDGAR